MGRNKSHPIRDEQYFHYVKLTDKSTCKECGKTFTGNHSGNLEKHYKNEHKSTFKDIQRKKELTLEWYKKNSVGKKRLRVDLSDSNDSSSSPEKSKEKSTGTTPKINSILTPKNIMINISPDELKKACLELITINGRPISIIEDSGFKKIISGITSGYKNEKVVINKQNIRDMIEPTAESVKKAIIKEVKNKFLSLKVDAATRLSRSFLGINIQFIKDDKIVLRTLAVRELKEAHTGAYLKSVIIDVLNSFEIKLKQIFTITSDNGANMLKCVDLISNELNLTNQHIEEIFGNVEEDVSDSVMDGLFEAFKQLEQESAEQMITSDGILKGIRCAAHTLQLAIFDSIKKDQTVEKIISKARAVVKKLRTPTMTMLLNVSVLNIL